MEEARQKYEEAQQQEKTQRDRYRKHYGHCKLYMECTFFQYPPSSLHLIAWCAIHIIIFQVIDMENHFNCLIKTLQSEITSKYLYNTSCH